MSRWWPLSRHRCRVDLWVNKLSHAVFKFNVVLRPQRPSGLLSTRSPPRLAHSFWALSPTQCPKRLQVYTAYTLVNGTVCWLPVSWWCPVFTRVTLCSVTTDCMLVQRGLGQTPARRLPRELGAREDEYTSQAAGVVAVVGGSPTGCGANRWFILLLLTQQILNVFVVPEILHVIICQVTVLGSRFAWASA